MIGLFKLVRNDNGLGTVYGYGSMLPSGKVTVDYPPLYYTNFEHFESFYLRDSGLVLCWIWRIDEATLEIDPRSDVRTE